MRSIIWGACVVLAGCATQPPIMDLDRAPTAAANFSVRDDQCLRDAMANQALRTMRLMMQCHTGAMRQFYTELALSRMDIFDSFSVQVMVEAGKYDDDIIDSTGFSTSYNRLHKQMTDAIIAAIEERELDIAKQQAALAAFGKSLQEAGRAMDGNRVNCTSVQTGNITNTSCR